MHFVRQVFITNHCVHEISHTTPHNFALFRFSQDCTGSAFRLLFIHLLHRSSWRSGAYSQSAHSSEETHSDDGKSSPFPHWNRVFLILVLNADIGRFALLLIGSVTLFLRMLHTDIINAEINAAAAVSFCFPCQMSRSGFDSAVLRALRADLSACRFSRIGDCTGTLWFSLSGRL